MNNSEHIKENVKKFVKYQTRLLNSDNNKKNMYSAKLNEYTNNLTNEGIDVAQLEKIILLGGNVASAMEFITNNDNAKSLEETLIKKQQKYNSLSTEVSSKNEELQKLNLEIKNLKMQLNNDKPEKSNKNNIDPVLRSIFE